MVNVSSVKEETASLLLLQGKTSIKMANIKCVLDTLYQEIKPDACYEVNQITSSILPTLIGHFKHMAPNTSTLNIGMSLCSDIQLTVMR